MRRLRRREYYQNYVRYTKSEFFRNQNKTHSLEYHYWKDGQCHLLPYYKNTLSKDIEI
jgi:hypothetical protein